MQLDSLALLLMTHPELALQYKRLKFYDWLMRSVWRHTDDLELLHNLKIVDLTHPLSSDILDLKAALLLP